VVDVALLLVLLVLAVAALAVEGWAAARTWDLQWWQVVLGEVLVLALVARLVVAVIGWAGGLYRTWVRHPLTRAEAELQSVSQSLLSRRERTGLMKDLFEIENSVRGTSLNSVALFVQTLVTATVFVGLFFTWSELQLAREANQNSLSATREGQAAERFARAIEQLASERNGAPTLESRLGAVSALERIALDSKKNGRVEEYWSVIEFLTGFVRATARWERWEEGTYQPIYTDWWHPRDDVQAILTVIGRRAERLDDNRAGGITCPPEGELARIVLNGHLNLRGAALGGRCLTDAVLDHTRLEGATLYHSHLDNASLNYAHLNGANLDGASLRGATLRSAQLGARVDHNKDGIPRPLAGATFRCAPTCANLSGADLTGADLTGADLTGAIFWCTDPSIPETCAKLTGAVLTGARLDGANFTGAVGLTREQIDAALDRGKGAILPDYLVTTR
jgi:uncharacterized protein YjbI with pentapeptide repeats